MKANLNQFMSFEMEIKFFLRYPVTCLREIKYTCFFTGSKTITVA